MNPDSEQVPPAEGMDQNVQPKDSKPKKKMNIFAGKGKYEIIVFLVILLAVGGALFYLGRASKQNKSATTHTTQVAVASPTSSTTTPNLPPAQFISGNTYLDSAKQLNDLGFFKNYKVLGCDSNCVGDLKIKYYQIGSTAKSERIIVVTYLDGPGGDGHLYAIENKPGNYNLLAQNSFDYAAAASDWVPGLNANVTFDDTHKLDDIKMPLQATVANQKMKVMFAPDGAKDLSMQYMSLMKNGLVSIRGGYYDDVANTAIKKLGTQGNTDFYEVTAKETDNYKAMEYYGVYKQLFSSGYTPNGEIASATGALNIKWSSGANNKSTYFSAGQGCGSTGYIVAKNVDTSKLIKVGTTPGGQAVYQLPGSHPLVQETYTADYGKGENVNDDSLKNLTLDQFSKQHAYFLAKNGLGEYVMFLREDMIIHGGCAKPVVYLYPQHEQQVSVKVGAQVVNSDPAYGTGWNNVTAYPDGSLQYAGKTYGSLFWDGYGDGPYPEIKSGSIVRTAQAESVVSDQLKQQGLNSQEISDFMNYWRPKLGAIQSPYTRLTWLGTAQMQRLAPLQVSPQPQTLIRVFLDFQAVTKPYNLQPQKLSALPRNGFTVVEWGGLARQGLN